LLRRDLHGSVAAGLSSPPNRYTLLTTKYKPSITGYYKQYGNPLEGFLILTANLTPYLIILSIVILYYFGDFRDLGEAICATE